MAETAAGGPNLDDLGSFTKTIQAGEFVFRAGDAGGTLFVIQDGRVELLAGVDGPQLDVVDTGGVFGETSFFSAAARDLSARAVSDVRLIRLDRAAFDRISAEAPQIVVSVLKQVASRAGTQQAALRDALVRAEPPAAAASVDAPADAPAPALERGEPKLVDTESGTEFALDGLDEAVVGRRDASAGFVPAVDLTALDGKRTLSRQHAKLIRRDGRVFVCEAKGRNGTFVNGARIEAGAELELHDGDQVQFGFVKTVFQWR